MTVDEGQSEGIQQLRADKHHHNTNNITNQSHNPNKTTDSSTIHGDENVGSAHSINSTNINDSQASSSSSVEKASHVRLIQLSN